MLAAIALFLVTVSVDAFYHNAIAAEFSAASSELPISQAKAIHADALAQAEGADLPSQQTMERLSHNGLTHGSFTRHHLTSAHLFTDM